MTSDWLRSLEQHATPAALSSRVHGPRHWRDVARVGLMLAAAGCECDVGVVLAFAGIHDTQRLSDGADRGHGARAAQTVERIAQQPDWPLRPEQTALLAAAAASHELGSVTTDPTIGACWDADRLTLWRVGITPHHSRLSTTQGRTRTLASQALDVLRGPDGSWLSILSEAMAGDGAPRAAVGVVRGPTKS